MPVEETALGDASCHQTPTSRRIVAIQSPEMWTGIVNDQTFLEIPAWMDLKKEEDAWFALGGDGSGMTFAGYLLSRGAITASVQIWTINYQ